MKYEISDGMIHSVEVDGKTFNFEKPVPASQTEEVEEHVGWLAEHLEGAGHTQYDEWSNEELRNFLRDRKDRKHNQMVFLKFLADNDVVTKDEVHEHMEEHSKFDGEDHEWGSNSLGGMKGGLVNKMNGKGKERVWRDRKNSDLPFGQYEIKEKYREVIQDELSDFP